MCVERTHYGSGDEISAALPAGHLGRADRRMESLLAGWLGQRPAVLLGDGDQGEELSDEPRFCSDPQPARPAPCSVWSAARWRADDYNPSERVLWESIGILGPP